MEKETLAQVFFCESYEISKDTFFTEHLRMTLETFFEDFQDSDVLSLSLKLALLEKCPKKEFFLVRILKDTVFEHFSQSVDYRNQLMTN